MIKKALQLLKRTLTKPEGLTLNDLGPVSRFYGEDRGTPIDRYYIEDFLAAHARLITGTTLEIADDKYTRRFGQNVIRYEVLHFTADNPAATVIGDLTDPSTLPAGTVDCFVCTQTFNFIYDFGAAIRGAHHLLKPGGHLLATLAGPCQISRYDADRWGDYWRFTSLAAKKMFGEAFGDEHVHVDYYGNCFSAVGLVRGLAAEEVAKEKLDAKDKDYEVIVTVVAKKA